MVELKSLDEREGGGVLGEGMMVSNNKKYYTLQEVAAHKSPNDCWLIIHGKIYDVTKYLDDHPGGDEVLLVAAGEDATDEFEEAGHSSDAWKLMEEYLIGQVVDQSSNSSKVGSSSEFLYKALPAAASVLVLGLIVAISLWRRKRAS